MIPQELIDMVKRFEGCRLKAYYDDAGVLTCGWGATGPDITPSTVWTQEQADKRMIEDIERHYVGAQLLVPGLESHKMSAVGDFAYNLGLTRFQGSTLRRKILKKDFQGASQEFKKWVRAGGRILPGLVARRECERKLFISPAPQ